MYMPTTKKEKNLHDLFIAKLSVLLDIEKMLLKALPKLAKAATDSDLKDGFKDHLEETKEHVYRLEQVFNALDTKPQRSIKSAGIRGIIEDGEWVIKNVKPKGALDANLIAVASYAEHYEMAGYMAAIEWATTLEYNEVADVLKETLKEEMAADEKLTQLGRDKINLNAVQENE
jgi:ferritin-like metal-binding protein YciE